MLALFQLCYTTLLSLLFSGFYHYLAFSCKLEAVVRTYSTHRVLREKGEGDKREERSREHVGKGRRACGWRERVGGEWGRGKYSVNII